MKPYIIPFEKLKNKDVELVGGKNASIGEMISSLGALGVSVPGGFATTSHAYRDFLAQAGLDERIREALSSLDVDDVERLAVVGKQIRGWMLDTPFPARLQEEVLEAYRKMGEGPEFAVAVRSSATAEDLPEASFAGQQETFLNVRGEEHLLACMHEVYASLFNDRAIAYRVHSNFDHNAVALSVGVQHMVRSDLGAAGVMFTLDTDSGFRDVVFITAAYGLGETVVQGAVNPDEFYVYKPALRAGRRCILRKNLGQKAIKMIYGEPGTQERVRTVDVAAEDRQRFSLDEADVIVSGETGAHHRGALRHADGHRMGQGRRHRQDLHPAGAARDGAKPRRTLHSALHAQGSLDLAGERTQHRPAHRRRPCPRHPRREGDVARARRRRAGRRHDRSGLGAGHEARLRHRHQSRRAHLPCGHHCARARHPGGGRLRHRHQRHPRKSGRHRLLRRGRHRPRLRRHAGIRPAQHRARFAARDPGQDHDEHRQSRSGLRFRRHTAPRRRPRAPGVHHQSHDRRASAGAAGIRQAKPRTQGDHHPADRGLSRIRSASTSTNWRKASRKSPPRSRPSR